MTSVWIPHLNPSMAAQVEVELGRVCDGAVHCGACWDIAALPDLQEEINKIIVNLLRNRKQINGRRYSGVNSFVPSQLCPSRRDECGDVSEPQCRWCPACSPPPDWCRPSWWLSAPATRPDTTQKRKKKNNAHTWKLSYAKRCLDII